MEVILMTTTPIPMPAGARTDDRIEANRTIAVDFLTNASAGHAAEAMARHAAPDFVHHNPFFASDADTLASAMDENARQYPDKRLDILRTVAEGDLVAIHSRVARDPGQPPVAAVHVFRIDDGRIRELWDVAQPTPEDSPNRAGMF
jgi:predicted SnoaL-like aldol condensation-catalyzing enzyme